MRKQRRGTFAAGGLLLAAVLVGGAACTPDRSTTRIDVIVNVDPRLGLDEVAMTLTADGRKDLQKSVPVTGGGNAGGGDAGGGDAGGSDASSGAAIAPISWHVAIANASAPMLVTATARGRKATVATVTAVAKVHVGPGETETVVLTLSAACMGVTCSADKTCMASGTTGMCVTIPVTGLPDGGGGDSSDTRADARPDGEAGSMPDTGSPDSGGPDGGMPDAPPKTTNGGTCTAGGDCMSTHCVAGVCCNEACTQVCTACTMALTVSAPDGMCAPIASGRDDPGGGCAATLPETCGTTGHCNGAGACERFGSTTTCQSASCGGGNFTPAGTCSGTGDCLPGTAVNCQGFACSATTGCATTCTSDANCTGGYCTAAMTCAAKKTNGSTCGGNNECTSASCVGGVCCEDACARAVHVVHDGRDRPEQRAVPPGLRRRILQRPLRSRRHGVWSRRHVQRHGRLPLSGVGDQLRRRGVFRQHVHLGRHVQRQRHLLAGRGGRVCEQLHLRLGHGVPDQLRRRQRLRHHRVLQQRHVRRQEERRIDVRRRTRVHERDLLPRRDLLQPGVHQLVRGVRQQRQRRHVQPGRVGPAARQPPGVRGHGHLRRLVYEPSRRVVLLPDEQLRIGVVLGAAVRARRHLQRRVMHAGQRAGLRQRLRLFRERLPHQLRRRRRLPLGLLLRGVGLPSRRGEHRDRRRIVRGRG